MKAATTTTTRFTRVAPSHEQGDGWMAHVPGHGSIIVRQDHPHAPRSMRGRWTVYRWSRDLRRWTLASTGHATRREAIASATGH